jgi:tetratricopeptide (TPR) repeat protein
MKLRNLLEPISKIRSKRGGGGNSRGKAAGGKPAEGLAELTRGRISSENEASEVSDPTQPRVFLRWVLLAFTFPIFVASANAQPANSQSETLHAASPEVLLNTGLKHYQASQFNEASEVLRAAVQKDPKNPVLLYNLGLSEFKLGKAGLAIGLWRRALSFNPGTSEPTLAIQHALKANPTAQNAEHSSLLSLISEEYLRKAPFQMLVVIGMGLCAWFLVMLFRFLILRQKVLLEGGSKPRLGVPLISSAIFLTIGIGMAALHWRTETTPRGTVVKKVEAQSAPQADSAKLFELPEGAEVEIRARESSWLQVRSLTGKSGWLPDTAVLETQSTNLL